MPQLRLLRRAGLLAAGASLVLASSASAIDEVNTKKLRDAVTVNGILGHERALQSIANANGGTRASGTPGYDASAAYVSNRLERAGYDVTEQEFEFPFFQELADPVVAQVTPTPTTYETATFQYSGSGDVTGKVVPTSDVLIPPPAQPGSTSGCEASDFTPASPTAPQVALIQRGSCSFEIKATNAQAAGYDAVIIFNEGQAGRQELVTGTLGNPGFTVPVVGLSFADGSALYTASKAGDVTVRVSASTLSETRTTTNVLADSAEGDADRTVVVGAHLDSVLEGPGINDNGSGSSTILEIAEEAAKLKAKPRQKLRFAFWGAEESGLLGSQYYVDNLGPEGVASLYANLNFDMLGSPNYVRFVYDGDGTPTGTAGPPGSAQIEGVFTGYFESQGLATEPTAFDGRSDYGPFIAAGVPAGGLFSGAEGLKTPEEAAVYGGTAGLAYDENYHEVGDDISNLNTKALFELGDGAADAAWTLARTKTGFFEDGSRTAGAARKAKGAKRAKRFAFRGSYAIR